MDGQWAVRKVDLSFLSCGELTMLYLIARGLVLTGGVWCLSSCSITSHNTTLQIKCNNEKYITNIGIFNYRKIANACISTSIERNTVAQEFNSRN
jgi:hypothetical protein